MSIFKTLFLVGVFAYAHAGRDTVTLNKLALQQVTATGKSSSTMYFSSYSNVVVKDKIQETVTIIPAVLLEDNKVVGYQNNLFKLSSPLDGKTLHGMKGIENVHESTAIAFKEDTSTSPEKKKVEKDIGLFSQLFENSKNAEGMTPAKLASLGPNDKSNKDVLYDIDSIVVAATFDLVDEKNLEAGFSLNHVQVANNHSSGGKYYDATVTQPVNVSAPLYLFAEVEDENKNKKKELQFFGFVTDYEHRGILSYSFYCGRIKYVVVTDYLKLLSNTTSANESK